MNEVIMGLYEIEEQAGKIMERAHSRRQEMIDENKKRMKDAEEELEGELEGRLTILRSQLEEQAQEEITRLAARNQEQVDQMNENYQKNLNQYAREIVKRITEV